MSGRETKPRLPKMPGQSARRPRASLVAAAEAQGPSDPDPVPADASVDSMLATVDGILGGESGGGGGGGGMDVDAPPAPAAAPSTAMDVDAPARPSAGEPRPRVPATRPQAGPSRPGLGSGPPSRNATPGAAEGRPKIKFQPKMPIRRQASQPEPEVKAEPGTSTRGRGRGRGRGTGATRGRGGGRGGAPLATVAAGPFGGNRPAGAIRRVVPPPPPRNYMAEVTSAEVYSDNEDGTRAGVIDIEAVSGLGESAPTSVYRERDLDGGKAKAKALDKAKIKEAKRRRKAAREAREAQFAAGVAAPGRIKDEPLSPSVALRGLPEVRHGDSMIAADAVQDRDETGRRVAMSMSRELTGMSGTETPEVEVDAANALNLSESEEEEYEEDMEGDFVFVPGMDNPEDKLFTFQFPTTFPRFVSRAPIDGDEAEKKDDKDNEEKKDVKPTPAALRKKKAVPPPEGRVGTLAVMKSGKVKLVLGEGEESIVMNVNPGVPSTFLTQLVHLDPKKHATNVLGEVHKAYTVMPDVERLLDQLFLNGGETPGDRERQARIEQRRAQMERGLVKMEPSSP